ncbi:polyprenyl synthetase [Streptomyces longisporoflavus]|uniref:polyprenyl synthetase family protein n=1 Tax=Streptomyces longisporoflavus TaxID=28044 RepID=UPI00167ED0DB|nr:polyprenyl synthetase family protein [Streptomyces longisporoflavus]GGV66196.1 polyprenyl synthetase [Streptomyces longisporoflavus]
MLTELGACLNTDGNALSAVHRHALLPAGKLLRPLLVVQSAISAGGTPYAVMPAAVGLELLHAGSLVHDDIIDGDTVRRGRPSVHHRFGADRAIIGGDALFFQPFALLAECRQRGVPDERIVTASRVLAGAGQDLCRGAMLELDQAGALRVTVEEYLHMAGLKTSPLLSGACRIGAILAGAPDAQVTALGRYGHALGLAFQARDDLLPYDTPSRAAGKPACSDLANHRPTLPIVCAYRLADAADRHLIKTLLADGARTAGRQEQMGDVLRRTGALQAVHEVVAEHVEECLRALSELGQGPGADELADLAVRLRCPSDVNAEVEAR